MKFAFPWSVKDIRPGARGTAHEAARRAGLPVNEWLNTVIMQQAAEQGIKAPSPGRSRDNGHGGDSAKLHLQIDDLIRRMDQIARDGPAAYAPRRQREETDHLAEVVARLEQQIDQFAKAARPLPAPEPAHDLWGFEDRLQQITDRIRTLRRPEFEQAHSFRVELGDIGHKFNEALPGRAIEIVDQQIFELTQRLTESRRAGADSGAAAGIEQALAEMRQTLRGLIPAENLVGYAEAVNALAQKIDLIVAENDPAAMRQLEGSLATLREIAAYVASNEAVSSLSQQVRVLADRINNLTVAGRTDNAISTLEARIDTLSRAVAERADEAVTPRLEALIRSLADKIEGLQQSRSELVAFGHLEDRIVQLTERLDLSNARLGHLEAIERGLADLLVYIEEVRNSKQTSPLREETTPGVDVLRQDVARTKNVLKAMHGTLGQFDERLGKIEKNIHGDRQEPAQPESDILELTQPVDDTSAAPEIAPPSEIAAAPVPAPPPASSQAYVSATPPAAAGPVSSSASSASTSAAIVAITATLPPIVQTRLDVDRPPDQPLEPGSPPPRQHPSVRIAASEAVLGNARSSTPALGAKADFIAAARRAAQAAMQDQKGRPRRPEPRTGSAEGALQRARVMTRVKSAVLAASIVAIIVGSTQFIGNVFDFGFFESNDAKIATGSETGVANSEATAADDTTTSTVVPDGQSASSDPPSPAPAAATTDPDVSATLLAPPTLPSLTPAAPSSTADTPAIQPPLDLNHVTQGSSPVSHPSALTAPSLGAPAPKGDVTGSVVPLPPDPRANRPSTPLVQPPATDRLPAAIGGPRLRSAALTGDASAAFEVATRFAEGRGVSANLEEAARWFERAASKGLAPAQFRYASMLEKGQGVKKDLIAARRLYLAAAGRGNAKAMHNLAVLYAEGAEGKPDYASAAQWFRKAAEYGIADSQYNLAVLTMRGLGTERNIAESYKWFALAAAQGDREAGRKRDEIAAHLDAQTLATAQQAVKDFTAAQQPADAAVVPQPAGGWDHTAPLSQEKAKAAGPLSLSAFTSGKL